MGTERIERKLWGFLQDRITTIHSGKVNVPGLHHDVSCGSYFSNIGRKRNSGEKLDGKNPGN